MKQEEKPKPVKRVHCTVCERWLPHYAHGMCHQCYRKTHVPKKRKWIYCLGCSKFKPHHVRQLCNACYMIWWRKQQKGEPDAST